MTINKLKLNITTKQAINWPAVCNIALLAGSYARRVAEFSIFKSDFQALKYFRQNSIHIPRLISKICFLGSVSIPLEALVIMAKCLASAWLSTDFSLNMNKEQLFSGHGNRLYLPTNRQLHLAYLDKKRLKPAFAAKGAIFAENRSVNAIFASKNTII